MDTKPAALAFAITRTTAHERAAPGGSCISLVFELFGLKVFLTFHGCRGIARRACWKWMHPYSGRGV